MRLSTPWAISHSVGEAEHWAGNWVMEWDKTECLQETISSAYWLLVLKKKKKKWFQLLVNCNS